MVGEGMLGSVRGSIQRRLICLKRQALAIDERNSNAWTNLGIEGGGVVQDTEYSKVECYQKVLCRGW